MNGQMTANGPAADPGGPGFRVLLALESQVRRYGLERMMTSIDIARDVEVDVGSGGLMELRELAPDFDFVVVALRELDEAKRAALERARQRGVRILLLLDISSPAERAMAVGIPADGFLDEAELTPGRLSSAFTCISNGDMPMHAELAREVLARADHGVVATGGTLTAMTARESEVLALLVDGLTNRQIARRLAISEHGAKRLVGKILLKLDCPSRTAAVSLAIRSGSVTQAGQDQPGQRAI